MHEPPCIARLREQLHQHGLPRQRLERILREVAEHWEDAYACALEQGLDARAARAQADAAIGNPAMLAGSFVTQLRCNTWLGRHRWLTLAVLPTLLLVVVFAVMALPMWGIDELTNFSKLEFWKRPPYVQCGVWIAWTLYCAGSATVLLVLSWWVWQAGLGWRLLWLVWASCLLAAAFRFFEASAVKRHVVFGFRFPPRLDTHSIAMLLLHVAVGAVVFALIRFSNQTTVRSSETHES
jgi:hypothetical protein